MENAEIKSFSFDSTDVITASTPEVFNNSLFTFSGFDNSDKGDGLIKGDWENKHYELTNGNYESLFTKQTEVSGSFTLGGKPYTIELGVFFDWDNEGSSISNVFSASADGEFIFNGTSFIRKQ